jgi:hypothetical protein
MILNVGTTVPEGTYIITITGDTTPQNDLVLVLIVGSGEEVSGEDDGPDGSDDGPDDGGEDGDAGEF